MKLTLHFLLPFLVCSLCLTQFVCAQSGKCIPAISFNNEMKVDTSGYIKSYSDVKEEETEFNLRVKHGNSSGNSISTPEEIISANTLVTQFYNSIDSAMTKDSACAGGKCLSALRIIYGLTARNKIQLLYQPLYLSRMYSDIDKIYEPVEYEPVEYDTNVYVYNVSQNKFVVSNHTAIDNYRSKVHVRRERGSAGRYTRFDYSDDARSIIFSFQEIIKFYNKINKDEISSGGSCKDLAIHNGASFHKDSNSPPRELARHTIFITSHDWLKMVETKSEVTIKVLAPLTNSGDGANLAHLCPPSCTSLYYNVN